MKLTQKNFENILIFFLVAGCIVNPYGSALAILIILGAQASERYFTRNVSDADRDQIKALKLKLDEHAEFIKKENVTKAFGARP